MREKLLFMIILALAVSGCGIAEVEGEVLDPTEAADHQILPSQVPPEPTETGGEGAQGEVFDGVLPAQTDGEILCIDGDSLQVELYPRQIEIIYNPKEEDE